jgi:hypothetical protein
MGTLFFVRVTNLSEFSGAQSTLEEPILECAQEAKLCRNECSPEYIGEQ